MNALDTITTMDEMSRMLARKISEQKEAILMKELNELVSRGLLVIEETRPALVGTFQSINSAKPEVKFEQGIRLVLKDQEYIEKLEKENKELQTRLDSISEALQPSKETP